MWEERVERARDQSNKHNFELEMLRCSRMHRGCRVRMLVLRAVELRNSHFVAHVGSSSASAPSVQWRALLSAPHTRTSTAPITPQQRD